MHTYYLRCIEPDYPTMIALGTTLGVITTTEDGQIMATESGCWDYIGPIYEESEDYFYVDEMGNEEPIREPKKDADGNTYIHVNLRSPIDIIGMDKFILLDAEGNPTRPNHSHRIFAGD